MSYCHVVEELFSCLTCLRSCVQQRTSSNPKHVFPVCTHQMANNKHSETRSSSCCTYFCFLLPNLTCHLSSPYAHSASRMPPQHCEHLRQELSISRPQLSPAQHPRHQMWPANRALANCAAPELEQCTCRTSPKCPPAEKNGILL